MVRKPSDIIESARENVQSKKLERKKKNSERRVRKKAAAAKKRATRQRREQRVREKAKPVTDEYAATKRELGKLRDELTPAGAERFLSQIPDQDDDGSNLDDFFAEGAAFGNDLNEYLEGGDVGTETNQWMEEFVDGPAPEEGQPQQQRRGDDVASFVDNVDIFGEKGRKKDDSNDIWGGDFL